MLNKVLAYNGEFFRTTDFNSSDIMVLLGFGSLSETSRTIKYYVQNTDAIILELDREVELNNDIQVACLSSSTNRASYIKNSNEYTGVLFINNKILLVNYNEPFNSSICDSLLTDNKSQICLYGNEIVFFLDFPSNFILYNLFFIKKWL